MNCAIANDHDSSPTMLSGCDVAATRGGCGLLVTSLVIECASLRSYKGADQTAVQ